jgi:phosphopantetheinyl transferase
VEDKHITSDLGKIIIAFRDKPNEQKKREFEKNEIKSILDELDIPRDSLSYGAKGNPILTDSDKYISISHSDGWFAVYHGSKIIGIDIQTFHDRISLGKSYFTNENEIRWTDPLDLHLIWATKEAIFKKYNGDMIDPLNQIIITEINFNEKAIQATYNGGSEKLKFEKLENAVLVYTLS